jgi:hypothetical protein
LWCALKQQREGVARNADSACAFELTRRVAGNVVAIHAAFANIDALTELPCVKILISLGDAKTLLIGVLGFPGT